MINIFNWVLVLGVILFLATELNKAKGGSFYKVIEWFIVEFQSIVFIGLALSILILIFCNEIWGIILDASKFFLYIDRYHDRLQLDVDELEKARIYHYSNYKNAGFIPADFLEEFIANAFGTDDSSRFAITNLSFPNAPMNYVLMYKFPNQAEVMTVYKFKLPFLFLNVFTFAKIFVIMILDFWWISLIIKSRSKKKES